MLAHWLPYRSFDPKTQLYYNNASRGFILEISPLVGADDRTSEIIAQFLSEGIPERTCVQIVQWQSPRVSGKIGMWYMPRSDAGGIYERMAQHRCDHIKAGVWASLSRDAPFHLRSHRVIVSLGVPEGSKTTDVELVALRDSMIAMLRSIDVHSMVVDPVGLMALIDDFTSPTTSGGEDVTDYNPSIPSPTRPCAATWRSASSRRDRAAHRALPRARPEHRRHARYRRGGPIISTCAPMRSATCRHAGRRGIPRS
jgi:conjugal transfer ATP-binding protein TraC